MRLMRGPFSSANVRCSPFAEVHPGPALSQSDIVSTGHAIELRPCAAAPIRVYIPTKQSTSSRSAWRMDRQRHHARQAHHAIRCSPKSSCHRRGCSENRSPRRATAGRILMQGRNEHDRPSRKRINGTGPSHYERPPSFATGWGYWVEPAEIGARPPHYG